jgi:hypothetical protein
MLLSTSRRSIRLMGRGRRIASSARARPTAKKRPPKLAAFVSFKSEPVVNLVETPPSERADEFRLVQHIEFRLLEIAAFHHQFGLRDFRYNARRLGDFFGFADTLSSTCSHIDASRFSNILTFGDLAFCGLSHGGFLCFRSSAVADVTATYADVRSTKLSVQPDF